MENLRPRFAARQDNLFGWLSEDETGTFLLVLDRLTRQLAQALEQPDAAPASLALAEREAVAPGEK